MLWFESSIYASKSSIQVHIGSLGSETATLTGRKLCTAFLLTRGYCYLYQTSIYSVVCLHNLSTGNIGSRLCMPSHVSSAMVACTSGVRMGSSHSFLRTALSCCTLVAPFCTPQVSGRREACLPRYDTSLGAWSGRLQIS